MAFSNIRSYSSTTSTAAVNQTIDLTGLKAVRAGQLQAEIETKTSDLVFKWKTAADTADASDTLTSGAYVAGNYHCLAGTVKVVQVPDGVTGYSTKALGAGAVFVNLGFGDRQ